MIRDAILTWAQQVMQISSSTTQNQKLKCEKQICSEVSVNSLGIHGVSPQKEKEGYAGKDLQKREV